MMEINLLTEYGSMKKGETMNKLKGQLREMHEVISFKSLSEFFSNFHTNELCSSEADESAIVSLVSTGQPVTNYSVPVGIHCALTSSAIAELSQSGMQGSGSCYCIYRNISYIIEYMYICDVGKLNKSIGETCRQCFR